MLPTVREKPPIAKKPTFHEFQKIKLKPVVPTAPPLSQISEAEAAVYEFLPSQPQVPIRQSSIQGISPTNSNYVKFRRYSSRDGTIPGYIEPLEPPKIHKKEISIFDDKDVTIHRRLYKRVEGSTYLISVKFLNCVAAKLFDHNMVVINKQTVEELKFLLRLPPHPNLLLLHGILYQFKTSNEIPIGYIMEYLKGGNLRTLIHVTEVDYDLLNGMVWIRQIASALCFLHRRQILHRDIRPANVLLSDDKSCAKLFNIGLSQILPRTLNKNVETTLYLSPEQIGGGEKMKYTEKTDVFALGIMMWEIVHRRIPYSTRNISILKLLNDIENNNLRPKFDYLQVPPQMAGIIERCWLKDPLQRPSVDDIHTFAYEYIHGEIYSGTHRRRISIPPDRLPLPEYIRLG